jgi:hypothetical protein
MNEKPPIVLSALAAFLCLAALPFGVAIFAVVVPTPSEAWLEGGWPMYAVILLGVVASLVNAAGVFFLTRGAPWAAGLGLFLSIATAAAGAFGYRTDMSGSYAAIAHAAPDDRTTIMHGATGESLNCAVLGSAVVAGLFCSLALATLLASLSVKGQRRAFALFGLGAGALSAWQALLSLSFTQESNAFKAMAHGAPTDLATLLFSALESAHDLQRLSAFALLGVVVLVVIAGAVLREQRAALAAVVGALLVSVAGLGGLRALVHPTADELAALERPNVTLPLRAMHGTPVDRRDRALALTAKGFLGFDDAEVTDNLGEAISHANARGVVNLRLAPDLTGPQLLSALRTLRDREVESVRLIGQTAVEPPLGFTPPRPFPPRLELLTGVRVLLPGPSYCEQLKCEFGELGAQGLVVGGETFALVKQSLVIEGDDAPMFETHALHLEVGALELEPLLDAAHTAAQHERVLALHL